MLHVCQEWSVRNRMQINNTQKTKVMAFFETPSLRKARGGQHRPGPTLPPFHIPTPFPTSSPCSYLITEVLQFEYLRLILDPKLTMHLAPTKAIRRAAHGQSVTQAVSYSLRYDKKRYQLTPTQNLIQGARRRRALARRRRAPTGSDQSHEDDANRGVSWGSCTRGVS